MCEADRNAVIQLKDYNAHCQLNVRKSLLQFAGGGGVHGVLVVLRVILRVVLPLCQWIRTLGPKLVYSSVYCTIIRKMLKIIINCGRVSISPVLCV